MRVVNGWNEKGEPAILYEGPPPKHFDFGVATSDEIWITSAVPAAWEATGDPTLGDFRVEPPLGGSICRVATYKPGAAIDIHSTKTVDYVIVVSGELTLVLEGREIMLSPGRCRRLARGASRMGEPRRDQLRRGRDPPDRRGRNRGGPDQMALGMERSRSTYEIPINPRRP